MASFSLMERYFSYPHGKSRICPFSSSQMRVANLLTKYRSWETKMSVPS